METPVDATASSPEISGHDIWKIFGKNPERVLQNIQPGQTRSQVLTTTGHVLGVRGVSFDVRKGQTFVVMGLSGSGKSTLVRCISRLTEPTRGEILVNGQDVLRLNEKDLRELRRHKVSMVFQNFGLFPHRKVIDNVAYGLEVQGVDKKARYGQAEKMIELVGLTGWAQLYPKQLSGGMQQRVGLARALAVDPEILLFDEPFSALDPLIRREMQDELIRLQTTLHKTIIFITHDFAEALKLGDRIAIMKDGQFVQVGTPEELVTNPQDDYVRAFTKDAPRAKVLTAARVMRPAAAATLNGNPPAVRADAKLEELLPLLADNDVLLPVVDEAKNLVGWVDRASVLQALVESA
jgi:glycine betaine/proline transport system ATP-binding protein